MISLLGMRLVFGEAAYLLLSAALSIILGVILLVLDGLLFISPSLVLYLPEALLLDFSLLVLIAILSGIVSSMFLYRHLNFRTSDLAAGSTGLFGSVFGVAAGVCGCSSVGFAIVTSLGAVGSAGTAFVSNFQLPLRIVSLSLLMISLFYANRSLTQCCRLVDVEERRRIE